jgi:hypothetical protein
LDRLSKEAIMVLRVGGKYAIEPPLKPQLESLLDQSYLRHKVSIENLSASERERHKVWKDAMKKSIADIQEPRIARRSMLLAKGMRDLRDLNLVVKLADKNLGITAMFGPTYRKGLENAIHQSYIAVEKMPYDDIVRRLCNIVKLAPRGLKPHAKAWVEHATQHKEPATFYVIPKLHKPKLGFRPIAAAHSYPLAALSGTLSDILNRVVAQIDGIATNSKEVVNDLEERILPQNGVFLGFDVVSMYPSMDIDDTLNTLLKSLPALQLNNGFLFKALQLLLRNSYISAQGNTYRQTKGIATGTQTAPALANLYLHEKIKVILEDPDIFWSKRYIDDGVCYVRGTAVERIRSRIENIQGLSFTFDIRPEATIFLDLEIFKGPRFARDGRMDVKPYFKPTNMLLYLPFSSAHPLHMKAGIIRGEAVRLLRSSTDKEAWLLACDHVFKGLLSRGYPAEVIAKSFKKIRFQDRALYLGEKRSLNNTVTDQDDDVRDPEQQTCERDKDGNLTLVRHNPPDRATVPYKGFVRVIKTKFHPMIQQQWKLLTQKHPLTNVLRAGPGGRYAKNRMAILKRWPPTLLFRDFQTVASLTVSSKQTWPGPHAKRRAEADRKRRRSLPGQTITHNKRPRIGPE